MVRSQPIVLKKSIKHIREGEDDSLEDDDVDEIAELQSKIRWPSQLYSLSLSIYLCVCVLYISSGDSFLPNNCPILLHTDTKKIYKSSAILLSILCISHLLVYR